MSMIDITRKTALSTLLLSVSAVASTAPTAAQESDGAQLFQRRCAACHSVDPAQNKTGPHLSQVIGRRAATVEGATYSSALRDAGITWDRQSLDRFLTAPRQLVPGTRMSVTISDAKQRAAIIDYLENPSTN
jgi:cytochrome c